MSSLSEENSHSKAAVPENMPQLASTDQTNDASAHIADSDVPNDDGPAKVEGSKPDTHVANIDNVQGQELTRESGSTATSFVLELDSRVTSVSHLTMETFDDSEEPEMHASMLYKEDDAETPALKHAVHAASSESRSLATDDELLKAKKTAYLKPEQNKGLLQDGSVSGDKKSSKEASIESIDGVSSCPLPFCSTNNDMYDRKVAKKDKSLGLSSSNQDDESIVHPPREEGRSEAPVILEPRKTSLSHLTMETLNDSVEPERHASMLLNEDDAKMPALKSGVAESPDVEERPVASNSNSNETAPVTTIEENFSAHVSIPLPNQVEPESHLIEAYAVDEQIYSAEKVEVVEEIPWWKQRRTKFLVAGLSLFVVSVSAITAKLSRQTVIPGLAVERTESPSMSFTPSLSPTTCIEASAQEIGLEEDDWIMTAVAIDGKNSAIAVYSWDDRSTVLHFYRLNDNGDWQKSSTPFKFPGICCLGSISLFNTTAFVATGDSVAVYEQNSYREWLQVNEPFVFQDRPGADFGRRVNVDGDLACVQDIYRTLLFKREVSKWVQFDIIDGVRCSISQNTVVVYTDDLIHVYQYNADENEIVSLQEPIQAKYHYALHNKYLVYSDLEGDNVAVLKRNETDQTYVFQQQLHFGDDSTLIEISEIELHNDVLAVATGDEIKVVLEKDGMWAERDTLYSPNNYTIFDVPNNFALSQRNIIASSFDSVYAYNIEDCVQSASTTQYPTFSPTKSSSPSASMPPTTSTSPTSCVEKTKLQIDLGLGDPQEATVAADGNSMVVAVWDGDDWMMDSTMVLQFYRLINESDWQLVSTFEFSDDEYWNPSISLSGSTAFVGFAAFEHCNGTVVVYEKNDAGKWEEVDDPFVFSNDETSIIGWGVDVEVDGDLACVTELDRFYLFHRDGEKWVEINGDKWEEIKLGSMEGSHCSISKNTIAVVSFEWKREKISLFEFMNDQNEAVLIQDPIYADTIYGMDHNNDYLVYSGDEGSVYIYKRNNTNGTFAFQQQLNVTEKNELTIGNDDDDFEMPSLEKLRIGNDNVLAISTFDNTRILIHRDDTWDVMLEIDVGYRSLALSEHSLIGASFSEVHVYPLQSCADDVTASTLESGP